VRRLAALTAVLLGLTACGSDDSDEATDSQQAGGSITVATWGGAYEEAQKKAFFDPWERETGNEVTIDGPMDYAKITAQVRSGNVTWDIADVEGYVPLGENCGTLFEKLDFSKIDRSDLVPELTSDCGAPLMQYMFVLAYDPAKFGDNPPKSWADFFDTEKYPGKRGVWNYVSGGALEAALLADGVQPDQLYPIDYDRAFGVLDAIKDDVAFYDTGAQQQEQLETGEVAMSLAWTSRLYAARQNGSKFEPAWSQPIGVWESLSVVKGSENKDLAMDFIAYALKAKPQARFTETIPLAPVNLAARPRVSGELEQMLPTNPVRKRQLVYQDMSWMSENFEEANEQWTAWTQG
jgi:putative spermidine/putrescine transport system substrate-binding protein